MRDPLEGLAPDGTIRTGADRRRVPARFEPLLARATHEIRIAAPEASVHVYGSVATGAALVPRSDVDLLTVGLGADDAAEIGGRLSLEFADLCRGVEIGPAAVADLDGAGDESYGFRVFLRHYCVLLAGPDLDRSTHPFPGDRSAARGFNGDIGRHLDRWRAELATADTPDEVSDLGRRVARKTLLAVAGLASVHDTTWTTDRATGGGRWSEVHPELADDLAELADWSTDVDRAERGRLAAQLDGTVDTIRRQFADRIGLW